MDSDHNLGEFEGRVELSGFGEVDKVNREAVDRIVAGYARKFEGHCENFQTLKVTLKGVHTGEKQKKIQICGKLIDNGKSHTSEVTDHDLLATLDKAMAKLEHSIIE